MQVTPSYFRPAPFTPHPPADLVGNDRFHMAMLENIEHELLVCVHYEAQAAELGFAPPFQNKLHRQTLYWQNLLDRYCTRMKL